MANTELAQKIKDSILESPEEYDQAQWIAVESCGTTRCVAGWAVFHQNYPLWESSAVKPDFPDEATFYFHCTIPGSTRPVFIGDAARDALGIPQEAANWLFDPMRSQERVIEALDYIIADDVQGLLDFINR